MRYVDLKGLITKKRGGWGNQNDLWKNGKLKTDFEEYIGKKCWYCECYPTGSDTPIEHFRPKSKVVKYKHYKYNQNIKDKGYYWLKDDPYNYRYSCTYSNSKREGGGKQCYFPLVPSSGVMPEKSMDVTVEKPMLLDPCKKEDVKLLTFIAGKPCCSTLNVIDNMRVDVSIDLYNLNESDILGRRMEVWDDAMSLIKGFDKGIIPEAYLIDRLKVLIDRKRAFSGAAIAVVKSWNNERIKAKLDLEL